MNAVWLFVIESIIFFKKDIQVAQDMTLRDFG